MFKTIGLTLAGLVASIAVAHAGLITDTVENDRYLSTWQSYSFSHDINDDGFTPGSAVSGSLSIDFRDDRDQWWEHIEWALVVVDDLDLDTDGLSYITSDFHKALGLEALVSLNANGMLDVTVTSLLGDFYLGNSVLSVITEVPEPGTIALVGAGLFGLYVTRRRKEKDATA
ncbi:PEP-CTERM sorting domain-containing protein [Saccharospirillum impatiens]|uniref:PEP-CTERM sorting domain-containing protein n=1 Tax=Saccharospirillum impatiens TaxID=169438 RepID=UPI0004081EDF|nr:PEP-CTERM sorting domain-containing protein [Saccharospirillum impatiens]